MRFQPLALALFLISLNLFAQDRKEKYFSSEEKAYYAKLNYPSFKPIDKNKILSFSLPHISIKELSNYTSFKDIYHWSPKKDQELERLYSDEYTLTQEEKTSGVRKVDVIKKGVLNGKQAILYTDRMYDDYIGAGVGVWVALYDENLRQWQKYYTGLAEFEPLYLKWESSLPLFKNSNTLQVEAAFLRKLESENFADTGLHYKYELIKDGVAVEFDIVRLTADTDGDGLTDIAEKKMALNPLQKDSNGDGITDEVDPNPRFNLPRTEKTAIYEAVLSDSNCSFKGFKKVPFSPTNDKGGVLATDSIETYLIVSDSKDVQGIENTGQRLIILNSEEYEKHQDLYSSTFQQYYLSPLFKVDNVKDSYKLNVSYGSGGTEYLVKKGRKGWKLKMLSMWIT